MKKFEQDLDKKIYETQIDDLLTSIQHLTMGIKIMKSRIDISKQLIKLIIKIKKEYENVNGKLRESFALCHCAEAGDDQDEEFQKRFNEKKR